jgi:hypothetical protein
MVIAKNAVCYVSTRTTRLVLLFAFAIKVCSNRETKNNVCLQQVLTPWSRGFLEKLTVSQLVKKFPHFMEPEGSLPHSQEPATCPYPEPAQSSPCPPSHFFKIHSILSSHLCLGLTSGRLPLVSPPKSCMHLSFPPYVLHAPHTSFFSIWLPE